MLPSLLQNRGFKGDLLAFRIQSQNVLCYINKYVDCYLCQSLPTATIHYDDGNPELIIFLCHMTVLRFVYAVFLLSHPED